MYGRPPQGAARPADETLLPRIARACHRRVADAPRIFLEFEEVDQGQFFPSMAVARELQAIGTVPYAAEVFRGANARGWVGSKRTVEMRWPEIEAALATPSPTSSGGTP